MAYRQFIVLSIGFLLLLSCKNESKFDLTNLDGKWNFEKAFRNGRETKTLSSAYFEFVNENVSSNIFSTKDEVAYEISDDKLVIKGEENINFKILELDQNFVKLRGKMGVFDLEIHLTRYSDKIDSLYNAAKQDSIIEVQSEVQ